MFTLGSNSNAAFFPPAQGLSVQLLTKICMQQILENSMNQEIVLVKRYVAVSVILIKIYSCVMLWVDAR